MDLDLITDLTLLAGARHSTGSLETALQLAALAEKLRAKKQNHRTTKMKPIVTIALYPLEFLRGAKTSPAGAGGGLIGRTVVMVVKLDESGKHWQTCKRLKI